MDAEIKGEGVATFRQWAAQSHSPLHCPLDLLDAFYPPSVIDYWVSTFLVVGRDGGGFPLSHAALRVVLRDIQAHLLDSFCAQAPITANLFAAGVPEALIQKRTGHRSLDSLRLYETRGNDDKQTSAVSKILAGNASNFSSEVKKLNTSLDSVGETIDEDALSSDFMSRH